MVMNKKIIWIAAVMMACAGAGAWLGRANSQPVSDYQSDSALTPDASADATAIDAASTTGNSSDITLDPKTAADNDCQRLLGQPNSAEALAWLSADGVSRGVSQWEKPEAVELVKAFYDAGAPKVWVVATEKIDLTEVAAQFIVQLPADPAARAKVFEQDADFEANYGEDGVDDIGQKFLHLTTD
jgi:hypothetical protein